MTWTKKNEQRCIKHSMKQRQISIRPSTSAGAAGSDRADERRCLDRGPGFHLDEAEIVVVHIVAVEVVPRLSCGAVGQLGLGHTIDIGDNESPASAANVNVGGTVVQLDASQDHTCVVRDDGYGQCWGAGGPALGYGNRFPTGVGDSESPASAGEVISNVILVAAGWGHTCMVHSNINE
jgi:hypothetical protein